MQLQNRFEHFFIAQLIREILLLLQLFAFYSQWHENFIKSSFVPSSLASYCRISHRREKSTETFFISFFIYFFATWNLNGVECVYTKKSLRNAQFNACHFHVFRNIKPRCPGNFYFNSVWNSARLSRTQIKTEFSLLILSTITFCVFSFFIIHFDWFFLAFFHLKIIYK